MSFSRGSFGMVHSPLSSEMSAHFMAATLRAALRRQQAHADDRAERAVALGRFPDRTDFVVVENAGARLRMRILPPHAAARSAGCSRRAGRRTSS